MNDRQRRRFERLARAHSYGAARSADLPPTSKGGQALTRLGELIREAEQIDAERTTKERETRQATSSKRDARETLREQLYAISDTAHTIGLDHPELKDAFPRPRTNVSDQTLLSTARSFAASVMPHKARFVEYDLPADFVERLGASINDFEGSAGRQTTGTGGRVTAGAALEDALSRAEGELERLDTAVRNKYRGDGAALAAWDSARRLERTSRKTVDGGSAQGETIAPAPK